MHIMFTIAREAGFGVLCLLTVDFLSGLLHWAEDTWTAPGRSALLDKWIVNDNIEHHRRPGTIRGGRYWETNRVSIVLAAVGATFMAAMHVHAWQPYVIALLASQANQVHMWAHSSDVPRIVAWLQRYGILQSRRHHGRHHVRPYNARFCAYTDFVNPVLDAVGFWRGLEALMSGLGFTIARATPARGGY